MTDTVQIQIENGVGWMTLNRPASLNALDPDMAFGLESASRDLAADVGVRCIVVRGAGGHFMAGGDIALFATWLKESPQRRQALIKALIAPIHDSIRHLRTAPKPVLASVSGACAGFGLSLMAACDLAIAAHETQFSLAYCRIGASPDGGSTFALPRMVGMKRAMALALLGDRFTPDAALAMGLVNQVVSASELPQTTLDLATRLAQGPTAVLARTKALMNASIDNTLDQQLAMEEQAFLDSAVAADFAEGVQAFLAKRAARFEVPAT